MVVTVPKDVLAMVDEEQNRPQGEPSSHNHNKPESLLVLRCCS
jgi:hypothetical protein